MPPKSKPRSKKEKQEKTRETLNLMEGSGKDLDDRTLNDEDDETPTPRREGGARKAMNSEDGMVKCEGCDRWIYLEATPFDTLAEAETSRYRCALCIKIEVLKETLQNARVKAKEEWRGREECLKTLLEAEREARKAEEQRRGDLERRVAELGKALEETQRSWGRERRENNPGATQGENQRTNTDEDEEGANATLPVDPGRDRNRSDSNRRESDNKEREARERKEHSTEPGSKEAPQPPRAHPTQPMQSEPMQQRRAASTPLRPPKEVKREIIVAGDGNVGRFAEALVREVGVKDSVEFLYQEGATVDQVHEAIREYEELAREIPRKYVLHLGCTEVLQGKTEYLTAKLEETWKERGAEVIICSVPQATNQDKERQKEVVKANTSIQAMCQRIGARFLDVSKGLSAKSFTLGGHALHLQRGKATGWKDCGDGSPFFRETDQPEDAPERQQWEKECAECRRPVARAGTTGQKPTWIPPAREQTQA
ncbi:unnamed protein product, partial [Ixodes persulcatus]